MCDLAAREAACCPFLTYDIALHEGTVTWTTGGADRPDVRAVLDEYYAAPDWAGQGPDVIAGRMQRPPTAAPADHIRVDDRLPPAFRSLGA